MFMFCFNNKKNQHRLRDRFGTEDNLQQVFFNGDILTYRVLVE